MNQLNVKLITYCLNQKVIKTSKTTIYQFTLPTVNFNPNVQNNGMSIIIKYLKNGLLVFHF